MEISMKRKNETRYFSRKKIKEERNFGNLDKDTYEYFSRIAKVLKEDVDEEEMAILASNTLKQTEGIELDVSKHIVAASVIEKILPYASWSQIQSIIATLDKEMDDTKGSCESRLEETIFKEAGRRIRLDNCEEREECFQYISRKSERLLEDFYNGIWNSNINFAARTCLTVCSGYEEKENNKTIISKKIVKQFSQKIMLWPELSDCYQNNKISGFLQILLYSLKTVSEKSCKTFTKFLIRNCFMKDFEESECSLAEKFENVPWSRLLEATIDVASPKLHEEIYQKLFFNHLEDLAISKKGHFPVCKLIRSCNNKIMFESIMEKLKDKFSDIISANNLNILVALSEACVKIGEKQGDFIKSLTVALGCSGPNKEKYVLKCIISMKTFNEINLEDVTTNFHGSLIFQNLLKFKKPLKFVEALLSLNLTDIKQILTDPKGCHIMDAFISSTPVGTKSKDRLLNTLKGHYSDLALDKYGSRSFDVIWAYASMKNRSTILSEMSRQVMKTQYGSIIASKTGLEMYLRDNQAWERAYSCGDKTNLFADIIKPRN